jgi:hypothetical protein
LEPVWAEMRAMGVAFPIPPSAAASRREALRQLWANAGLTEIETREIAVQRTFASFDEFWTIARGSSVGPALAAMGSGPAADIEQRLRKRLPANADGRLVCDARANAIKGRVPK